MIVGVTAYAVQPPLPASLSSNSSSKSSGMGSLNLYVIIGALVFALLAACAVWLFVRARRQRGKKAALQKQGGVGSIGSGSGGIFSIDALAVTLGSDDAAPPAGEKSPTLSAADWSGVFEIPFEDLALEPRPFARGGGGQVMYHTHERTECRE